MASLSKRYKKKIKQYSRKALAVGGKISRVARPIAAAAAGYFAGPAGVMAVTALSHYGQQYQVASGARGEGIRGREAREMGREAAQRTTKHSLIAGGAGMLGSGITSMAVGGNFFGGLFGGQAGSALLGGNTVFGSVSPGASATTIGTTALGSVGALSGVQSGWDSLAPGAEQPGAPVPGASNWDDLIEAVAAGAAGGLAGGGGGDDDDTSDGNKGGGVDFSKLFGNSPTPDGEGGKSMLPWLIAAGLGIAFLA